MPNNIRTTGFSSKPFSAKTIMERLLPDLHERHVILKRLVDSVNIADEIAPESWSVTLFYNGFRLNIGRIEAFLLRDSYVLFNMKEAVESYQFAEPYIVESTYKSVSYPKSSFSWDSVTDFVRVVGKLSLGHQRFIEHVAVSKSGKPRKGSYRKYHSDDLIQYAREFINEILPANERAIVIDDQEFIEGRIVQIDTYERNKAARAKCIEIHGTSCKICEMDLSLKYGPIAKGRIHVHHLRPISEVGIPHQVDPRTDLIPVCPNCHFIIHLRVPAYTVDEAKELMKQKGGE